MSAITDCIIVVLIMRHGNGGEEKNSVNVHGTIYFATIYMKQCRGVRENQTRCVNKPIQSSKLNRTRWFSLADDAWFSLYCRSGKANR